MVPCPWWVSGTGSHHDEVEVEPHQQGQGSDGVTVVWWAADEKMMTTEAVRHKDFWGLIAHVTTSVCDWSHNTKHSFPLVIVES